MPAPPSPPPARPTTGWPAYALGVILGMIAGLLAAELSFLLTGAITGRDWATALWWQYALAGVAFILVAMAVMVWVGRRVRAALRPPTQRHHHGGGRRA